MVTSEGHFEIDGKTLCNLAKAEQQNDAVNLQSVQDLIKKETDTIYDVIASFRTEMLHNNNMMIVALELTVKRKSKNMQADNKLTHKFVLQKSKLIFRLAVKLHGLRNEHRKAAVG